MTNWWPIFARFLPWAYKATNACSIQRSHTLDASLGGAGWADLTIGYHITRPGGRKDQPRD